MLLCVWFGDSAGNTVEEKLLTHSLQNPNVLFRPFSIWRIWIQIHSESRFGFTGRLNGLDSWVLSEVTSLLFVYVCDTDVTSGFASKSASKLDSVDSQIRIRICALNGRIHWIWKIWIWIRIRKIEYGLTVIKSMKAVKLCQQNPPVLNWQCWLTQVVLYSGHKALAVVVYSLYCVS